MRIHSHFSHIPGLITDGHTFFSCSWETEGNDRDSLALPGRIDELVFAVAAANPRVIVVNQSGSAVTMPWADKVPAIVQGWFIGCEMVRPPALASFQDCNTH